MFFEQYFNLLVWTQQSGVIQTVLAMNTAASVGRCYQTLISGQYLEKKRFFLK